MIYDTTKFVSFDTETHKMRAGCLAPPLVCGSSARIVADDEIPTSFFEERRFREHRLRGQIRDRAEAVALAWEVLTSSDLILVGANTAFDLGVLAAADESLLPVIFAALKSGRVYDILIAQSLDAIAGGHLGIDPRTGGELRRPSDNKVTKRYSLEVCLDLVCGRKDAKSRDAWRTSYGILDGIPIDRWPLEAQTYPVDDALNTLEVAIAQVLGKPLHEIGEDFKCRHCGAIDGAALRVEGLPVPEGVDVCERECSHLRPHRNLDNLPFQVEAAFALHLGACWGLRVDGDRVDALSREVEGKHRVAVERFKKIGWVREDGTEDQAAVKRALAMAYGATGKCGGCGGSGTQGLPCRGPKVRGRFQGCLGTTCPCGGAGTVPGGPKCVACDGTGLDLATVPMLPKTDKGGIKTDRDASMESGDDDVAEYSDNVFEKIRTTYVPYLRRGVDRPLWFSPNVLVATGRASYDTIHQMPRDGGVRECMCARPGYCLCSTDYASGEMCTLGQYCKWVVGDSRIVEIINATKDPGALHTFLASKMVGVAFEDALALVKAGDKQMKNYRQTAKIANFGFGGGMGAATFVLSSRQKSKGETKLSDGRKLAGIRFCVLIGGAEVCGAKKITRWGKNDIKPACEKCVEIVHTLVRPAFFDAYPEVGEYHEWVSERVEKREDALCLVWDKQRETVVVTRRRGGCGYSDMANNGFQALLADIFKLAYTRMTREGYLGGSPLAGARFPVGLHDEPIAELRLETAHIAAPRIGEIMEEAGREYAPDVFWKAEPAIAEFWSKAMEPVHDNGKLVLWRKAA